MNSILFWLGALVVVSVLSPVLKLVIAGLFGKQVGAVALAQQPDTITLQRRDASMWKNGPAVSRLVAALRSRGFEDAGVHAVAEMPGLGVQLMALERDGWYAAVYEHPVAGVWIDLASRFQDGSSFTVTTAKPTGLAPRPGHPVVNAPGLEPDALVEKAQRDRPRKWPRKVSIESAAHDFEEAYAESIAWRKQNGISRGEVMKVATRKVA